MTFSPSSNAQLPRPFPRPSGTTLVADNMNSARRLSPPSYPARQRLSNGSVSTFYDPYSGRNLPTNYTTPVGYTTPRSSGEHVGGQSTTTLAAEYKTDKYGKIVSSTGQDPYRDPRRSAGSISEIPSRRMSLSNQPSRAPDPWPRPSIVNEARTSADLARPVDRYARGGYYALPAVSNTRNQHRHSASIDDPYRSARAPIADDTRRDERGARRRESIDRVPTSDLPARAERSGYHLSGPVARREHRPAADYDYENPRSATSDSSPQRRHEQRGSVDTDRRASMIPEMPARAGVREYRPPPTARALERLNTGVARQGSLSKASPRSGSRDRGQPGRSATLDESGDYYIPPRRARPQSEMYDRAPPSINSPIRQSEEPRQSLRPFRDNIAGRGFGVRGPSAEPPTDRNENLDVRKTIPAGTIPDPRQGPELGDDDHAPTPKDRDRKRAPPLDVVPDRAKDKPEPGRRDRENDNEALLQDEDPDYAAILARETNAVQEHHPIGNKSADRRVERDSEKVPERVSDERLERGSGKRREREPDKRGDRDSDRSDGESRPNDKRSRDHGSIASSAIPVAAAGAAALAAGEYSRRHRKNEEDAQPRRRSNSDSEESPPRRRRAAREAPKEEAERSIPERRDVSIAPSTTSDDSNYRPPTLEQGTPDEDDEYRRILQQELQRNTSSTALSSQAATNHATTNHTATNHAATNQAAAPRFDPTPENNRTRRDSDEDYDYNPPANGSFLPGANHANRNINEYANERGPERVEPYSKALARYKPKDDDAILGQSLTEEPGALVVQRENRVRIVEPPREGEKPKGILRRPTVKFPDYPDEPKQSIKPLKPVEGTPDDTTWVKIKRSHVSPRALEEVGERFTETKDHVTILRPLTPEEIERLHRRSEEIRNGKDKRDDRDRDRDRRQNDDDDDEDDDGSDETKRRRHRHRKHRSNRHDDED